MSSSLKLLLPQCKYPLPAFSPNQHLNSRSKLSSYKRNKHNSVSRATSYSADNSQVVSLSSVAPLEAILFDIDGTLCDSDPLHFLAFQEMLQEVGFNGGIPITEEFFIEKISGKHNEQLREILLPDWDLASGRKFFVDKEALFRRFASKELDPVKGLNRLCRWIEQQGLKRAAVTNAPRSNAELLLSSLGVSDFFQTLVIANECERPKPFPDPYLKALQALNVSNEHTFVFEDSVSGVKAGVSAGMQVVGLSTRNPEKILMDAGSILVTEDFDDVKLWNALERASKKKDTRLGFK